jgi:hypothetical protein
MLLTLVALVTVDAVVHIPADVRVTEVGRVPAAMAIGALEDRVIHLVLVAGGADTVRVAVIHREEGVVLRRQIGGYPCHGW